MNRRLRRPTFVRLSPFHGQVIGLLIVLGVLPLALLGIAANVSITGVNQQAAIDRLSVTATNRAVQLQGWLDRLNAVLYRQTLDPVLHDALDARTTVDNTLLTATRDRLRSVLSADGFAELTLIGWDNRVLTSTSEIRYTLPDRTCGPRVICLFGPFREGDRSWLGIQYPFVGEQSEQIGAVVGLADTQTLETILSNRTGLGATGVSYLAGFDYAVRWLPGYGVLAQKVAFPPLSHGLTASETPPYTGVLGVNVAGVTVFVPLLNAWLVVEQASDEIAQPLVPIRVLTLAITALTLAAIVIGSRMSARGIDRLIVTLTARVDHLTAALDNVHATDRGRNLTIANMSHELRTPINATLNFSGFLLDGLFGDLTPDQTELIRQMHAGSQHLLELINDLLDISKIEAGQMKLFVTEYDPAPVFDQAIATLRALTASKPITVNVDLPRTWPTIRGDRRRMLQILLNLVSNAAKFTDQGAITLRVHVYATRVEIRIEDSGAGIDPADVPNLFEPFRQGHNALLLEKGGTGLGLPLSRIFARMHGGDLDYLPGDHGGAVFICSIPLDVIAYDQKLEAKKIEEPIAAKG